MINSCKRSRCVEIACVWSMYWSLGSSLLTSQAAIFGLEANQASQARLMILSASSKLMSFISSFMQASMPLSDRVDEDVFPKVSRSIYHACSGRVLYAVLIDSLW